MYFILEFLGLPVFVTSSEDSKSRIKMKSFLKTLMKGLPLTILKLYIVFRGGQTVGLFSLISLAKTYLLFSKGMGENVPFVVSQLKMEGKKRVVCLCTLYSIIYVFGLVVLIYPFLVFF